jgi:putative membrane protein
VPWARAALLDLSRPAPRLTRRSALRRQASGRSHAVNLDQFTSAFGLVLTTLSFLLVFRLNRAAVRYWTVRQQWGKLVEVGRQLSAGAAAHCAHAPAARDALCAWTCAFAVASKDMLRGSAELDAAELAGILPSADCAAASAAAHMPLFCAAALRAALAAALGPAAAPELRDGDGAAALAVALATCTHRAALVRTLEVHIDELVGQTGGMERVKATPLPVVYVAHLRTFLLSYLLLMPLVYVSHWGWGTIPAMALVAFAMLGVEGAATECECPFSQRSNHLAMDSYCATLIANVGEILTAAALHAAAPWVQLPPKGAATAPPGGAAAAGSAAAGAAPPLALHLPPPPPPPLL